MSLPDWLKRAGDHIIFQLFDNDDDSTIKVLEDLVGVQVKAG